MDYQQLHKKISRIFRWKYFFSLDFEEVKECVSDAVEACITAPKIGGKIIHDPESWVYRVAERKILRTIAKRRKQGGTSLTGNEDIIDEGNSPDINLIDEKDWQFDVRESVAVKNEVLYIRIHSGLTQKLFDLFLKHLKGNCLKIFIYMLIGWEDEDIQEEMEHKNIQVFQETRYVCMKKLREKLKESGDWDSFFD